MACGTVTQRTDLRIYQGDDYAAQVTVYNPDKTIADLTGATAKAQIRPAIADKSAQVSAEFTTAVQAPNVIFLTLANYQTRTLNGKYVWDLQVTLSTGVVTTILAGAVIATAEVTR